MTPTLARRVTAEAVGTAFLVAVVIGSGIFATRLSPDDVGLQLLENSTATAGGLVALILAFGSVSGAHFNPVVSLADRIFGGLSTRELLAYIPAQVVGACAGAVVANLIAPSPTPSPGSSRPPHPGSSPPRSPAGSPPSGWRGSCSPMPPRRTSSSRTTRRNPPQGDQRCRPWKTSRSSRRLRCARPPPTSTASSRAPLTPRPSSGFSPAADQFAATARIVTFLPLMAERFARQRLKALAKVEGKHDDGLPVVLFLCVHNAGRSQMALGWFCPMFPGKRYEDWELDDPAGQDVDAVRPIRDEIEQRVRTLLESLWVQIT